MKLLKLFGVFLMLGLVGQPATAQERVDQELEIPANARVVIDTMRGEVDIEGSETTTARVVGTLDKHAEKFIFELAGDTLTIKVEMPKRGNFRDDDGNDLVISLPSSVRVEAKSVSADFNIKSFTSRVSARSVSGDIQGKNLQGGAQLESVSGDIEASGTVGEVTFKSVSGDVKDYGSDSPRATYSTVSGDITAKTNARVVRAEAVSGDVELVLGNIDSLHVNTVSGESDIRLNADKEARVNVESVSGDVAMKFTGAVHADIEARSNAGGEIINGLNNVPVEKSKYGVGQHLNLQMGERSGSMSFRTVSGDIKLEQ